MCIALCTGRDYTVPHVCTIIVLMEVAFFRITTTKMDVKGCLCVLILIVASVCPPTVTAKNVQSISQVRLADETM